MTALTGTLQKRKLLSHVVCHRFLCAANKNVRLDTDLAQFRDTLLAGLRLELSCGLQVGEKCAVEEEHVFVPDLKCELAHCFKEGQAFDVTNRSP